MNPAYECPVNTPLEEMVKYIEEYPYAVLIIDENGVLLAKNRFAEYKIFRVRQGCSAKKLLPNCEFNLLFGIKPGEIRRVQLKTDKPVSAAAAGFWGYSLVFCLSAKEELRRSILDVNRSVGRAAFGVLRCCTPFEEVSASEALALKQLTLNQLRREMNLGKMFEILTGTGEEVCTAFSPFFLARMVCEAAGELANGGLPALIVRLSPTNMLCRGSQEDYCSAVAAMLDFAASNCVDGCVWAEGVAADRVYRFDVSFASVLTYRELEQALHGRSGIALNKNAARKIAGCKDAAGKTLLNKYTVSKIADADAYGGSTANNNTSNAAMEDLLLRESLLYIRCIAESELWCFNVTDGSRVHGVRGCGAGLFADGGRWRKNVYGCAEWLENAYSSEKKPVDGGEKVRKAAYNCGKWHESAVLDEGGRRWFESAFGYEKWREGKKLREKERENAAGRRVVTLSLLTPLTQDTQLNQPAPAAALKASIRAQLVRLQTRSFAEAFNPRDDAPE